MNYFGELLEKERMHWRKYFLLVTYRIFFFTSCRSNFAAQDQEVPFSHTIVLNR